MTISAEDQTPPDSLMTRVSGAHEARSLGDGPECAGTKMATLHHYTAVWSLDPQIGTLSVCTEAVDDGLTRQYEYSVHCAVCGMRFVCSCLNVV